MTRFIPPVVKLNVCVICWCVDRCKLFPTYLVTHSCFPLGFLRSSAGATLSSDWFLQTDAEGDTHSLINWPSRYTHKGWLRVPLPSLSQTKTQTSCAALLNLPEIQDHHTTYSVWAPFSSLNRREIRSPDIIIFTFSSLLDHNSIFFTLHLPLV